MVQPPPSAGGVPPYAPPAAAGGSWAPASSWAPGWPPPGQAPGPVVPPVRSQATRGPLVLAGVALAGVLAGVVGAAFLVTAVFVGSAEDIGREIGAALGPEIGRAAAEGLAQGVEESVGAFDEEFAWGGSGMGPVEQFPPVEPGEMGPDPVLDDYAASCFEGELQACDDLLFESAPLSEYERYALSCGGRVKQYVVAACTDLE